jgi:hypothetical protein
MEDEESCPARTWPGVVREGRTVIDIRQIEKPRIDSDRSVHELSALVYPGCNPKVMLGTGIRVYKGSHVRIYIVKRLYRAQQSLPSARTVERRNQNRNSNTTRP